MHFREQNSLHKANISASYFLVSIDNFDLTVMNANAIIHCSQTIIIIVQGRSLSLQIGVYAGSRSWQNVRIGNRHLHV